MYKTTGSFLGGPCERGSESISGPRICFLFLFFFCILSGAIDNCSTLCFDDPALQTHCLRQYITVPCGLPAILTERGHKAKESPVMCIVPAPQATPAAVQDNGVQWRISVERRKLERANGARVLCTRQPAAFWEDPANVGVTLFQGRVYAFPFTLEFPSTHQGKHKGMLRDVQGDAPETPLVNNPLGDQPAGRFPL